MLFRCWMAVTAALIVGPVASVAVPMPEAPVVAEASHEAELSLQRMTVPAGWKAELVAAEPLLANPVAFWIDGRGRIYVCETFRQERAVTDNRSHSTEWVDDDLAARTVADREAYHRKHLGEKLEEFTKVDDRIRLLEDTNGDGRPDRAVVFADGFNTTVEGTGAGVLAHGGDVFYTNIPNLWRLRDTDGDGKADERTSLASGFGVKVAYRGHDMHGLTIGPDGRLYWSIGDRGYHVELPDGRVLSDPVSGAVFRCELDGSNMEVFATGLRNPQELAFDDYGNLFTGDNNSDSGDKARWVYVVRGGDSGWRMHYQYLGDRGPFNREKIWYPNDPETPAYVVPPVINFADGPSGLTYYPGTGLSEACRGSFLLCDFRGGVGESGIRTLKVRPKGAGFEAYDQRQLIWNVLATDCDFGPDGALYITDWVEGWYGVGKGRIYKVFDPTLSTSPEVLQVKKLLAEGMADRTNEALSELLGHADRRIRQEAQFALVARGGLEELIDAATRGEPTLKRLAGVWGLGQLARRGDEPQKSAAVAALLALLEKAEGEVLCQALRQVGDALSGQSTPVQRPETARLVPFLEHSDLRVRFCAAEALGQLGDPSAFQPLVTMLAANADEDRYLRHAGVMGLAGIVDEGSLRSLAGHAHPSVRLAAALALRHKRSAMIAAFLNDTDERIVLEAARAIHDLPIDAALPDLAHLVSSRTTSDPLLRRVLNANTRLGNAEAVAAIAARGDVPEEVRRIALRNLEQWATPPARDPVHSGWRPLSPRDSAPAATALRRVLATVLMAPALREPAAGAATALGMPEANQVLLDMLADVAQPGETRAEALAVLGQLGHPSLSSLVQAALTDSSPRVRSEARDLLAKQAPADAIPLLAEAIAFGTTTEAQRALETFASLKDPAVDTILAGLLDRLAQGDLPPELHLELVETAQKTEADDVRKRLDRYLDTRKGAGPAAPYLEAMAGGDAARGRRIFFEKVETSCVRCHRVGDTGGEVGPKLSAVGRKPRLYLLESIVDPDRAIAEGFETIVAVTDDGLVHAGIMKAQEDTTLTLIDA